MELAPWAPYGTNTVSTFVSSDDRPRRGDLQPDLRPGPDQLPAQVVEGRSPWYLAYRRLRRNRVALAFGALFVLIVALRPRRAALGERGRRHRAERDAHAGEGRGRRRDARSRQPRRQADRPALARRRRQVLPRRRRTARPRRDGAADVRRADLALRRHRRGADHDAAGNRPRPARRLLPRLGRRGDRADAGRRSGPSR